MHARTQNTGTWNSCGSWNIMHRIIIGFKYLSILELRSPILIWFFWYLSRISIFTGLSRWTFFDGSLFVNVTFVGFFCRNQSKCWSTFEQCGELHVFECHRVGYKSCFIFHARCSFASSEPASMCPSDKRTSWKLLSVSVFQIVVMDDIHKVTQTALGKTEALGKTDGPGEDSFLQPGFYRRKIKFIHTYIRPYRLISHKSCVLIRWVKFTMPRLGHILVQLALTCACALHTRHVYIDLDIATWLPGQLALRTYLERIMCKSSYDKYLWLFVHVTDCISLCDVRKLIVLI